MTESYYPFDAGAGGSVTEAEWAEFARFFLQTGVIKSGDATKDLNLLAVYADSSGMQVKVPSGKAWVEGHFYKSDAERVLAIDPSDPTNPRIDRVVVEIDWAANIITTKIIKGTPAASPAVPSLTQTFLTKWQFSLAQVLVDAAAVTIAAAKITDERSFSSAMGGSSFWTLVPGSPVRASNTTATLTGDNTLLFKKGVILWWKQSGVSNFAMISIPSTYSSPNTTLTFIGDTMTSIDAGTLKYSAIGAEAFVLRFAVAGTIGATGTDIANAHYAREPLKVFGADLQVGTAGTTNNTTVDINKNGTTMFTTKPTLATTVASSPTPFTADSGTTLALGDKVTIDQDAVQTTPAVDEYVVLYVMPSRFEFLT